MSITKRKKRQDVFCYDCKKAGKESYFRDVEVSVCPVCGSEDADVYPEAHYYNRDLEKKLLHKEVWLTKILCKECGKKMIYRDDGYEKMFVCSNGKCSYTRHPKEVGKKLKDIAIVKMSVV